MTTSHKQPGVAFWTTVLVVVVLVAYPLSMGPTLQMRGEGVWPFYQWWDEVYAPMIRLYRSGPGVQRMMKWYLQLWLSYPLEAEIPTSVAIPDVLAS